MLLVQFEDVILALEFTVQKTVVWKIVLLFVSLGLRDSGSPFFTGLRETLGIDLRSDYLQWLRAVLVRPAVGGVEGAEGVGLAPLRLGAAAL